MQPDDMSTHSYAVIYTTLLQDKAIPHDITRLNQRTQQREWRAIVRIYYQRESGGNGWPHPRPEFPIEPRTRRA